MSSVEGLFFPAGEDQIENAPGDVHNSRYEEDQAPVADVGL